MNYLGQKRNRPVTKPKFVIRRAPVVLKKRRVQSKVQGLIGKSTFNELKCRDQQFTPGAPIATVAYANVAYVTPTVAGLGLATGYTCLNCVEQGNGVSQRIGNKIVITSIRLRGTITPSKTADTTDYGFVRVLMVYDKQTNGAAPLIGDIISNISTSGSFATAFNSGIKITNRNRFVMLRDQIFEMGATGSSNVHHFK